MKIYSIKEAYTTTNRYPQKQKNIAFTSNQNNGLSENEMESLKKAKGLFIQLNDVFCTDINSERRGTSIKKIPNCLMLEIQNDGDEIFPVEWLKKTADCNFVHLADKNNDDLMDNLWGTLQKSKDTFEQTQRRTLIYVEGFKKLITKGKNSFENIDSLKDIMNRCAKDFGATIIFRTKNASKLTSEAIQPHRVNRIIVNNSRAELEKYNAFLESQGHFKDYEKRMASKATEALKPEVKKDTAEVPSKPVEQPKAKAKPKTTEVQTKQHEPDITRPKQVEQPKSKESSSYTSSPRQSSEPKSSVEPTSSSTSHKNEAELKPPKTPDAPSPIKEITKKASDGPKAFKVVAGLAAIGAAIVGVIYFIKNKQSKNKVN